MPDLLELRKPGKRNLRIVPPRRYAKQATDDRPPSVENEKDLYLHVVHMSSARNVQENWTRIVRHAIESLSESLQDELAIISTSEDETNASIASDARKAVVRALRDLHTKKSSWKVFAEAATRLMEVASRRDAESPGDALRESFVHRALRLEQRGQIDAALDLLYDGFDELFRKNEFATADALLAQMSVRDYSVDLLLGVLTATLPARSRLPSRAEFYRAVESDLHSRGEEEDGLLTGLS